VKYLISILSILVISQFNTKEECYCLNLEDSQLAMINECIMLKPNKEFIYWWQSDLALIKEEGNWTKEDEIIFLTTTNQPKDYCKIERHKSEEIIDSLEIKIITEEFEDKSILSLVKYSKDSISQIPFNNLGKIKIESESKNEYGINAIFIPWQFKFKIEPYDKSINIKLKLMNKIHRTFFDRERIQIKDSKAYWIDKFEGSNNYWEKVDRKAIERKFN